MTISTAFNASVAGLNANATRLATISDNISNSGTYGYKRSSTSFESMVITEAPGFGTYSAGGVRASTTRLVNERGALVSTSNALDLSVSGRGRRNDTGVGRWCRNSCGRSYRAARSLTEPAITTLQSGPEAGSLIRHEPDFSGIPSSRWA
jgi:flagellar basal body rod protein FlgB